MANILIAGGSGFLGKLLSAYLENLGYQVWILTRSPKSENHIGWEPETEYIEEGIISPDIVINLCGSGIADRRWTKERQRDLLESRTTPLLFLSSLAKKWDTLQCVISASGIDCYPDSGLEQKHEEDAYSEDFIGELIETWEHAANTFPGNVRVVKMRMPMVLHPEGGALKKLIPMFQKNLGTVLGNGKQFVNWIHYEDWIRFVSFAIENKNIHGPYNICSESISNRIWTQNLANQLQAKLLLPPAPSFILKLVFGKMATILLHGPNVSNLKLLTVGFKLQFNRVDQALGDLLHSK